eukprot:9301533-Alexandrium_andersonii.AAC.1
MVAICRARCSPASAGATGCPHARRALAWPRFLRLGAVTVATAGGELGKGVRRSRRGTNCRNGPLCSWLWRSNCERRSGHWSG